jgi:hypothetical protein
VTAPDEDPERALARYAAELARGVEDHLSAWVVRSVDARMLEWSGHVPPEVRAAAEAAGERARAEVAPQVAEVLGRDIDDQPTPPLSILRRAVSYPTEVLASADVPHVVRDEVDERIFPGDVYALAPASFADVHPSLHEPGLAWGAAKAFVHLSRRRAEGRR